MGAVALPGLAGQAPATVSSRCWQMSFVSMFFPISGSAVLRAISASVLRVWSCSCHLEALCIAGRTFWTAGTGILCIVSCLLLICFGARSQVVRLLPVSQPVASGNSHSGGVSGLFISCPAAAILHRLRCSASDACHGVPRRALDRRGSAWTLSSQVPTLIRLFCGPRCRFVFSGNWIRSILRPLCI